MRENAGGLQLLLHYCSSLLRALLQFSFKVTFKNVTFNSLMGFQKKRPSQKPRFYEISAFTANRPIFVVVFDRSEHDSQVDCFWY